MELEWANVEFDVMPYKETGTYILKSPDEASQLLDDHIVMTQSMSFSPFKKIFEARINTWEGKLRMTQVGSHAEVQLSPSRGGTQLNLTWRRCPLLVPCRTCWRSG